MTCFKLILLSIICCLLYINPVRAESSRGEKQLEIYLQSGIVHLEQGNLEKARETFGEIIGLSRTSTAQQNLSDRQAHKNSKLLQSAYLHRGLAAYRLREYQNALADLETAQKIAPWQAEPYYNMGLAWSGKGEYERAIAEYNKALTQVSPQDQSKIANIYSDRGLAYLNLHNFTAAINDFNLGIRYQGKDSWLHYNRGCACHRRGDYTEAIESFSTALAFNPQQSEAYINRGLIHYHLGHLESALTDLRTGANSFYQQGQIKQYETAIKLLEQMQRKIHNMQSLAA